MRHRINRAIAGFAVLSSATLFGVIPSCETLLTTFNPCGSVFGFCNPVDIDRIFLDIGSEEAQLRDPSCTVPLFGVAFPGSSGGCSTTDFFALTPGI